MRHFCVPGSSSEFCSARENYFSYHLFLVLNQQRSPFLKLLEVNILGTFPFKQGGMGSEVPLELEV